jgi:hypothetical protein
LADAPLSSSKFWPVLRCQPPHPASNRFRRPFLTFDKIEGWEWIHPASPRYYLSKSSTGTWAVVDRSSDRAITPDYQTKAAAMRAFFRRFSK